MNFPLIRFFLFGILVLTFAPFVVAQPGATSAEQALKDLKRAANPKPSSPSRPGEKKTKVQIDLERKQQAAAFVAAANQAKEFQTIFPSDPRALTARKIEVTCRLRAARAGDVSQESEAMQLAEAFVADDQNSRRDRYLVASMMKHWAIEKKRLKDRALEFAEYETNAADLIAAYSDVPEAYYLFIGLARNAPEAKAREIIADLLNRLAPKEIKDEAQGMLDRLDLPGKTLDLKFIVNNGTEFDLAKHRGRPVVIYFWASWGRASELAMPDIQSASEASNASFIGVNLDSSLRALQEGLGGQTPPGLQRWEPLGLNGPVARQLHVNRVPSVYVFDQEGVLRGIGHPRELSSLLSATAR